MYTASSIREALYTCIYINVYIYMCVYIYVQLYIVVLRPCLAASVSKGQRIYINTNTNIYIYVYIYLFICLFTYIHASVYINSHFYLYIGTHTCNTFKHIHPTKAAHLVEAHEDRHLLPNKPWLCQHEPKGFMRQHDIELTGLAITFGSVFEVDNIVAIVGSWDSAIRNFWGCVSCVPVQNPLHISLYFYMYIYIYVT